MIKDNLYKKNILSGIRYALLLGVILTPIFSFWEILQLLSDGIINQAEVSTPLLIKLIKDMLFVFIIVSSGTLMFFRSKVSWPIFLGTFALISIVIFSMAWSLISGINILIILAGIRWSIPIFLPFFLVGVIDRPFMERMASLLGGMLLLHFIVQIYEMFTMQVFHGLNIFGFASRSPGIFFIPNTGAFFTIVCLFYLHFFCRHSWYSKLLLHGIVMASLYLTLSGTGIIIYFLFLLMLASKAHMKIFLMVLPVILVVCLLTIPVIIDRNEGYVESSLGTRVEIVMNQVANAGIVSDRFGVGTNSGAMLVGQAGDSSLQGEIVDSTYASVISNFGLSGGVMLGLLLLGWLVYIWQRNQIDLYIFSIIFLLYGATSILFEAYPMNLLFAIGMAYYSAEGE